jgi:transcriptional regulator with XRE-family HTH domain
MINGDSNLVDFRLASTAEVMQALGRRLRDQRMSKLITQEELAGRAGVALGAVKKLESTGKVTVETLVQVTRALGLLDEFTALFSIRAQTSIAEMERNALAKRQRARKRAIKAEGTP